MTHDDSIDYREGMFRNLSNGKAPTKPDLICFSHLRWDFVYQRPQHLLSRAAGDRRVYYVEEPCFDNGSLRLNISDRDSGVKVVVPCLPSGLQSTTAIEAVLQQMIDRLLDVEGIREFVSWYYTPMAVEFTRHLKPKVTVYDCMDELSAFKNAPATLQELEKELFRRADLVFTGGQSLYEAKQGSHHSVHAFPSSIDRDHFMQARTFAGSEPTDQKDIPHPRFGFFGVVDERFDIELLSNVASAKPEWNFVIIGPVVKIDPATLPQLSNIHYLGPKAYNDLPSYIAGWDVALLLFARNEATRFISPTKTPEYLAAGKPVVSTSIRDVVRPYGKNGLVGIADTQHEFIKACEKALNGLAPDWAERVDSFLAGTSWDSTWNQMSSLIDDVLLLDRRKPSMKSRSDVLGKGITKQSHVAGAA
jgi:UDP-galactopyranose mutase